MSAMYVGVLSMLVGALASAEERQFGTLESQLLLPVRAWQQWTVKVATCYLLAAILGVGGALLVGAMLAGFSTHPEYYRAIVATPAVALGLTLLSAFVVTIALYCSTTCRSGKWSRRSGGRSFQ